ncbi:MAG: betaine--homocysteine S-methyltransferase [Pseudomonadota bacterium]
MGNKLLDLLSEKGILLADGATGTTLFGMGLVSGDAPELWNADHPDRIRKMHQDFVDAGADLILTNTFGANARRLMLHSAEDRARELNRLGAEIAREIADAAGRPVIVAGSVGPTGDLFAPLGPLTEEQAVAVFEDQIAGLMDGGADVAWIETMSAVEEIRAALRAADNKGCPAVVTASFDTAGRTMMGLTPGDFACQCSTELPSNLAFGANCGVGASDLVAAILSMTEDRPDAIVIAKGNCGIPTVDGEQIRYTGTPDVMANYVHLAADAGAKIIGGCCGTTKEHLAAMRAALDSHTPGPRPTLDDITSRIGPMTAAPAAPHETRQRERRGRRRG